MTPIGMLEVRGEHATVHVEASQVVYFCERTDFEGRAEVSVWLKNGTQIIAGANTLADLAERYDDLVRAARLESAGRGG